MPLLYHILFKLSSETFCFIIKDLLAGVRHLLPLLYHISLNLSSEFENLFSNNLLRLSGLLILYVIYVKVQFVFRFVSRSHLYNITNFLKCQVNYALLGIIYVYIRRVFILSHLLYLVKWVYVKNCNRCAQSVHLTT